MSSITSRRIVITGGNGDLARAISAEFRSTGDEIFCPDREELDVRYSGVVQQYFEKVGDIDVLIQNAGVTRDRLFPHLSESNWDDVLNTNLKGAFLCVRAVIGGMMRRGGGHIVMIGSYSAKHPPLGQSAYAASKAGLEGLAKSLAQELGVRNIRVNCVLPGFLNTRMTQGLSNEHRESVRAQHSLGRLNTTEEAARFIRHLLSMEHISGQVFQLDSRT